MTAKTPHSTDLVPTLQEVRSLAEPEGTDKPKVILSDFDYTLCGSYRFNPEGRNHLPQISPDLIAAASGLHLVIATGRRANNPAVPSFWESGLIPEDMPAIAENGGSLVFYDHGRLSFLDLVRPEDLAQLSAAGDTIKTSLDDLPGDQRLVLKTGRTMLLAQLQGEDGTVAPKHQAWLAVRLGELLTHPSLRVVDTRASVTIQHAAVNKSAAFRMYLDLVGLDRGDIFVVGLGDGPNDTEIFEEADLSIGFSEAVQDLVDMSVEGPEAAPQVLWLLSRPAP